MNRRTILAALATTALAGCVSDDPIDGGNGTDDDQGSGSNRSVDGSVLDQFDGELARPECEVESETVDVDRGGEPNEYETAATIPYPDPPDEFDEDDVVEFVETFENAYVTHDVLCDRRGSGHVLRIGYDVETSETFDWDDDCSIVFLRRAGGATWGLDEDGGEWVTDLGYSEVVYAVDETGAARATVDDGDASAEEDPESRAPDPLEDGVLVATFN
ncbi:hypothetical protein ACLI4Z_00050 [Natrialbaceae archaeon A-arb3/5]